MSRAPTIRGIEELLDSNDSQQLPSGRWVPAQYHGFYSLRNRLKCAWLVFTGKADALVWTE